MGSTATIRVSTETRDRLAEIARSRGISIAQLLTQFSFSERIRQIYADERLSWGEAISNAQFAAELDEWDETVPDECGC